jgi:Carboxypeptidase regulatory-like domain
LRLSSFGWEHFGEEGDLSISTMGIAIGLAMLAGAVTAASVREPAAPSRPAQGVTLQPNDQKPGKTAALEGTVIDAMTRQPVRRARVALSSSAMRVPKLIVTDDEGHFAFTDLPAGAYLVTTSKAGYLDSTLGQKRAGDGRPGTLLPLADDRRIEHLSLPLARAGLVTGTVTDEVGDPVRGTTVRA